MYERHLLSPAKRMLCLWLFVLLTAFIAAGCIFTGADGGEPASTPEPVQESAAPVKSEPYLSIFVPTGTLYDIPVSRELDEKFSAELSSGKELENISPAWKEGWGHFAPQGTDYPAIIYHGSDGRSYSLVRNSAGRYGTLGETDVNEAIKEFMALIAEETGWGVHASRADYSGLTRIELVFEGEAVMSITDAERLRAFEKLINEETYAVSGDSNDPPTELELRCTRADGAQLSLTVDTEDARLWIPPFRYYRYNAYESTGVKPLLDALGLSDWPVEVPEGYSEVNDENFARLMKGLCIPSETNP